MKNVSEIPLTLQELFNSEMNNDALITGMKHQETEIDKQILEIVK